EIWSAGQASSNDNCKVPSTSFVASVRVENRARTPRAQLRVDESREASLAQNRRCERHDVHVRFRPAGAIDEPHVELRSDLLAHLEAADADRRSEKGDGVARVERRGID